VNVQASIFIARLLGPLLLAVGAGILMNPGIFRTMGTEVVRSVTLVYLFGLMDLAAGLAIVLTHNVWLVSWRVLITLLGWLLIVRGAARVLLTEKVMAFGAKAFRNKQLVPVSSAIVGILGLVLCYFGYVA
jgi:membrane protein CcdC involved in cytochrome C biogenesis